MPTNTLVWRPLLLACAAVLLLISAAEARQEGWHRIQRLTDENLPAQHPAVFANGDTVHVVFRVRKIDFSGVYYMRSDDRGKNWTLPRRISHNHNITNYPTIYENESGIHVAYVAVEDTAGSYQLFYLKSTDGGDQWTRPQHISGRTGSTCFLPTIVAVPSGIAVIFAEEDSRTTQIRQRVDPGTLNEYFENPMQALWPTETRTISRTAIKMTRTLDDAVTWRPASFIGQTQDQVYNLSAYQRDEDNIHVVWDTGTDLTVKQTKFAGERGEWTNDFTVLAKLPRLARFDVARGEQDIHIAYVERTTQAFPRLSLYYQEGSAKAVELVPKVNVIRAHPNLHVSGNNIHTVWSAMEQEDIWVNYLRTDIEPPESYIVYPTDPDIITPVFSIQWDGEDNLTKELEYRWRVAGDPWKDWTTDKQVELVASRDGDYQFEVQARDYALNVQAAPATFAFNTFKVAPDTRWASSVPSTVRSRSISLQWSGKDNATPVEELEYQYKLDDQEWSEFVSQERATFTDMTEGWHRIQVRARDDKGNVDSTPLEAAFNTILNIRVAIAGSPEPYSNETEATFQWEATDDTNDNPEFFFQSRLNDGQWRQWTSQPTTTYEDLTEGRHDVVVRARDSIGNMSENEAEFSFIVDLTPPETDVLVDFTGEESDYYPELTFEGTDEYTKAENIEFSYRVGEDGEWSDFTRERSVLVPIPIKTFSWGYVVYVRARDRAGNVDEEPAVKNLLLYARNPLLVYTPIVVVSALVIFLLVIVIGKIFGGGKKKRAPEEEAGEEDIFGTPPSPGFSPGDETPPATAETGPGGAFDDDDDLFGDPFSTTESEEERKRKQQTDDDDDLFG